MQPTMPTLNTSDKIQRVGRMNREEFAAHQDTNVPIIFTDVSPHWAAMKNWTLDYLKQIAPDSPVTVHYDKNGDFTRWYLMTPEERDDRVIPFGEFIDILQTDEGRNYYMTEHSLKSVSEKLASEVDMSGLVDLQPPWEPMVFIGRDTCMPMHYHGSTEAALCQLIGSKKITLAAPSQSGHLYARPWYQQSPLFSQVDGRSIQAGAPDFERWPRLERAKLLQFTLNPGEILYIPVHWWHLTSVPDISVSMTSFWDSKFSRWTFPNPGFQMIAREALWRVKAGFKKVGGRRGY